MHDIRKGCIVVIGAVSDTLYGMFYDKSRFGRITLNDYMHQFQAHISSEPNHPRPS